ncbi:MAG: Crp/Fnr family transcriptional regulator [Anaerolineae bacterium]|nr:Crp/Fnr family transcriptional regulator [Anaerolineae bacterium]
MREIGLQWGQTQKVNIAVKPAQRHYMSTETTDRIVLLQQLPLFEGLDYEALQILVAESRHCIYHPGDVVFYQGEPGITCHIVIKGSLRVFVAGEDGHELSVRILGAGEIVGEMALFENLPRSANVIALETTQTLELDQDVLLRCLRRSPTLALGLLRAMSERLRTTTEDAERLASLPVAERLLLRLQRLAQESGRRVSDGVQIVPPMTQQELATLVGTSRESVNRALVRLRNQGKVRLDGGWIILLNETN